MDWKKLHRWFVNNLQEPLLQAEMHRVDMQLSNRKSVKTGKLRVVEGGKARRYPQTGSEKKDHKREAL